MEDPKEDPTIKQLLQQRELLEEKLRTQINSAVFEFEERFGVSPLLEFKALDVNNFGGKPHQYYLVKVSFEFEKAKEGE